MRFLSLLIFTSLLSYVVRAQPIQKPKLFVTSLNDQVLVHTTYNVYQNNVIPSNGLIIKTTDGTKDGEAGLRIARRYPSE